MTNEMSRADNLKKPLFLAVTGTTLRVLAAFVWLTGGIVLLLKASSLLFEANSLNPGLIWPWLACAAGVILGGLKGAFAFRRSCRRNIERINDLAHPKIWQFFTPKFFLMLTIMITAGAVFSRWAHGSYPFLLIVAILDLSISIALLGSSYIFWTYQNPS